MIVELPVLGLILTLLVPLVFCFYQARRKQAKPLPPLCKGWIPWLGCAIDFGKNPLDYIAQKRKLGPIFTLYVAGERLTFITEAEDFHYFFQSPFVDFQKAVQDPVLNIASVSKTSFFKYHTKIHDLVKGRLASSRLVYFSDGLCQEFNDQLTKLGTQASGDLMVMVRKTMYVSVMNNLFGKDMLPVNDEKEFKKLEKMFIVFDDHFEYGARLPPFFLKDWASAKKYLLKIFSGVLKKLQANPSSARDEDETVLQSLLQLVQDDYKPNYSLLLLWASLANAIPITFWTLAFILHDERVLQKLRAELTDVFGNSGTSYTIKEEDLRRSPYLKWCVLEAVRLRPTGIITRRVVQSFTLRDMKIPEGDMLMLSPYWSHRNEKYFPEPLKYNPERWKEADIEKNVFLDGFVAFGGGRYQCPGRWYALLEIQMYVAMFLQMFDCKLLATSVPEPSMKHLVGTQQPDGPFPVEYRLRT